MGMESFFVHCILSDMKTGKIIPDIHSSVKSKINLNEFVSFLEKKYTVHKINEHLYNIDDSVLLNVDQEFDSLKEISLEVCFSWYEESLAYIYNILKYMCVEIGFSVYHNNHSLIPLNELTEQMFKDQLILLNKKRYSQFIERYGKMNKKYLPRQWFYKSMKKGVLDRP